MRKYILPLCSFNVQQPYPNKRIYQLSLVPQDKRKRIFGIPLVFKTYDEIRELSSVSIDWTVYDTDKACSEVFASHLSVNYRLSFPEIEPDEHFFTINTCDRLDYCFSEKESVSRMKYYEAFSVCLGARGIINIILDGIPRPLDIVEIYDLRKKRRSRKANAADDALIKQFYDMGDLSPWFPDIAYIQELCEAHGILEPQYLLQYLHQDVSMTAAPAADFVPEPAFGFKML